ncbi:putative magnesium transporter NIPA8 [Ananas comosus]|uniref:Probable magnesium transporter n=1 Tax=Ananas comosus TaxID=4615 RepID=A0A199UMY1_ANACO|nr:putative magnesium transporter NIPA8 [Ananas comosus]
MCTNSIITRERLAVVGGEGNGKIILKPIMYFQTWRVGILFFALGNCLNFISFAYAAQSLLAALGSIQFVSNIAFAYFVLSKTVSVKYEFLFLLFILYVPTVMLFLITTYEIDRRGEDILSASVPDFSAYWRTLLPFSYAVVSGAVGSCSVLFAKSL